MNKLFRLLVGLFCSLALAVVGVVVGVLLGMTRTPWRPAEVNVTAFGPWMGDVLGVAIVGFLGGILGLVAGTVVGWLFVPGTDRRPGVGRRVVVEGLLGVGAGLAGLIVATMAGAVVSGLVEAVFHGGGGMSLHVASVTGSWIGGCLGVFGGGRIMLARGTLKATILGGILGGSVGILLVLALPTAGRELMGDLGEFDFLARTAVVLGISLLGFIAAFEASARKFSR